MSGILRTIDHFYNRINVLEFIKHKTGDVYESFVYEDRIFEYHISNENELLLVIRRQNKTSLYYNTNINHKSI